MQERQDRPDYPTVDDPSFSSTLSSAENAGTSVSALEPYIPPNVPHGFPHGFPHVIRFATLSSMDLPSRCGSSLRGGTFPADASPIPSSRVRTT